MSNSKTEFYEILGVDKKAETAEIRTAYKTLAKKWHPDKNPNNKEEATEMFKKITEAHETLIDTKKRQIYDKHGKKGLTENGMGFDPSNMGGIFGQMFQGRSGFAGGFPGFAGHHGNHNHGQEDDDEDDRESSGPVQVNKEVSLSELFVGKHVKTTIQRYSLCDDCKGTGSADGVDYTCDQCHGKRIIVTMKRMGPSMVQQVQQPCNKCNATGKSDASGKFKKCATCKGKRKSSDDFELEYDIPAGAYDEYLVKIKNMGNEIPVKQRKGDETRTPVIVIVREPHHEVFIRKFAAKGNNVNHANILIKMEVSLAEAVCGIQREVKHLDGKIIPVECNNTIYEGDVYIIDGQGMPYVNKDKRGDLYIQFTIKKEKKELSFAKRKKIWQLMTDEAYTKKDKDTFKFPLIPMNDHHPTPSSDEDEKEGSDEDDEHAHSEEQDHGGPNQCPTQ